MKGASSALTYYSKKARPVVKEANPDMAFGDIAKKIGADWKALGAEEKKPFEALAAADKIRFANEKAAEAKAKAEQPQDVKRATSGFMYFAKMTRAGVKESHPDASFGEVSKKVGTMWKALDDSKKAPFLAEAEADKKRYVVRLTCFLFAVCVGLLLLVVAVSLCAVCVLLLCCGVVCVCVTSCGS